MASSSTALLSAAGSVLAAPSGASVVRLDTCSSSKQLSSSSSVAFCSSVVQLAPLRPAVNLKASRGAHVGGGATRASWSEEEQKTTTASGKKVLVATVLAAGVALGISFSSTGQAFALTNPVANGAIENAQSAAGDAVNETKRRVTDGIFGKKASLADKPRSSSSSGSSALEDAKARVQDFGNKSQNPIATNVEKAAKETEGLGSLGENSGSAIANRELLGQDSRRVDAATDKAGNLATEFQKKAGDAVDDVKQILSKAQEAASPAAPDLQGSFNNGVQSAKEAASKVQNPFQ
ncbi:unnamed protein product [Sphagnum jensenii]|uniref:Uncharacterized protein n=1 Tax=Sphagnum jensenii TaxID=128206 RepID=A0ABP0VQT3_9BRYO